MGGVGLGQRERQSGDLDGSGECQQRRQPVGVDGEHPVDASPQALGVALGEHLGIGGQVGGVHEVLGIRAGVEAPYRAR